MAPLLRMLLVLLSLAACHPKVDRPDPGKDLMPKGATMVATARGDDPNLWEKSFTVQVAYPTLALADEDFARLKSHDWKKCDTDHDKWASYVDKRPGAPATVYERRQEWRRGNDILQIRFSYRVLEGDEPTAQRVTLSYYGAQSGQDLDRWNRILGSCRG
jgi:hypothetical protein